MIIYKCKKKKVVLRTYYNLEGSYIPFDYNPLNNVSYEDVEVTIKQTKRTIMGINFNVDVIEISGQETIECELIDYVDICDNLLIQLCQDWG